jgi:DNA-binding MarR family transcriptional regulator
MSDTLSAKQAEVLDVYRRLIDRDKRPPTFQEAAFMLRVTRNAVVKAVRILERKGYLVRRPGVRNVVLTDKAQ